MEKSHKPKIYVIVSKILRKQISTYIISDLIVICNLFFNVKRRFYNWTWTYRSDSEIVQTMGPITQQLGEPEPLGIYLKMIYY